MKRAFGIILGSLIILSFMPAVAQSRTDSRSYAKGAPTPPEQATRFYKAENGTSSDYLELKSDGTYRVIAREHVGAMLTERGKWQQKGSVITFTPSSWMRGGEMVDVNKKSYEGMEERYKGKTFLTFSSADSAGIAIPSRETRDQLDRDNNAVPEYVFFKTTREVFRGEVKQSYPFRYIKAK